jgi:hypothetical protein
MIIYHGSNLAIEQIDLNKCRPFKDFGRGFYCTDLKEQAEAMARRVSKIYGGSPYVSVFQFDLNALNESALRVLEFKTPSEDWAQFVMNNRNQSNTRDQNLFSNHDHRYDLVIGPVADDAMYAQFQLIQDGLIDLHMLAKKLEFMKYSNQYSFHTNASLAFLSFVEVYVCHPSNAS